METTSVLFVEDEEIVRKTLERVFSRETYHKRFATCAQEALDMLAAAPAQVIVTDLNMPGMDGLALLKEVKLRHPDMIRMALTAHATASNLLTAINAGEVYRYLTKPLQPPQDVITAVRQAIEVYILRREQRELLAALEVRNRELEASLAQVRQLQGLLPICCGCKKIHTDDGYWQRIETYISEHSEVKFTHGLCPECAQRLYPEYAADLRCTPTPQPENPS